MPKNAQAALEYIMTYSWALVAIAIVVGVLVFVVMPPTSTVNFSCSETSKLVVKGGKIGNTGEVEVIAQNITAGQMQVTGFQLSGDFVGSKLNEIERTAISESTPLIVPTGGELYFSEITYVGSGSVSGAITIQYKEFTGLSKTATIIANGSTTATGSTPITECGATINSPGNYVLASDLEGCSGNGITVNADDVILNLANKTLNGSGTGNGINIDGRNNVTIQNSKVENFARGFSVTNSSNITLSSNTANYNTQKGFYFSNTSSVSFNSNIACCSGQHDVYCEEGGTTLSGTGNTGNAVYQCLADVSGCAAAGIICS